jgi:hypothetical protein
MLASNIVDWSTVCQALFGTREWAIVSMFGVLTSDGILEEYSDFFISTIYGVFQWVILHVINDRSL